MKPETLSNIQKMIAESRKCFTEHAFQNEVNSPHLKRIMEFISEIERVCLEDSEPSSTVVSQRTRINDDDRNDLLKIVYAMSRFDYPLIASITGNDFNQTEAFGYLEKATGVKSNTLKNMRDRFDPYVKQTRSNRKGWHQADLTPEYARIIDLYSNKSEADVAEEIKQILNGLVDETNG